MSYMDKKGVLTFEGGVQGLYTIMHGDLGAVGLNLFLGPVGAVPVEEGDKALQAMPCVHVFVRL